MFRLIAGAICVAWAFSAWRNAPRLDHPSNLAFGLAIVCSCAVCYFCGRSLTKAQAWASARAHAEARALARSQSEAKAQAAVQVFMGQAPEQREQLVPVFARGLESAPWIGPAKQVAEQDVVAQMIEDGDAVELQEYAE